MKITQVIVDKSYNLTGLSIEGTQKEFGGFGTEKTIRQFNVAELIKMNFSNAQVQTVGDILKEKTGFHFRDMPVLMYDGYSFIEVSNEINIMKRVLVNGELKGFEIEWGSTGKRERYVYADVIKLTNWCKPGNFLLRQTDDKVFIAGKPGVMKLGELPEVEIGNRIETGKRKRTSGGGREKEQVLGKAISAGGNLLELYRIIRECDGLIIKLPDEAYKAKGEIKEKVSEGFVSLGIGEIGNPSIDFGEKKLNANTTFKKVGNVMANVGGMPLPIYTFTWSSKSLFVDGQNYIKRFGIGVSRETAQIIIDKFGKQLIAREITDKRTVEPIASLTGKKDFVFFEVDSSKLEIMSASEAPEYILSNLETKKTVETLVKLKAHAKVAKDAVKKLSELNPSSKTGTNKPLFGLFAGMNETYLNAITEAGVDIFSGAYVKRDKVETVSKEGGEESTAGVPIEIEYDIVSNNTKDLNYASVVAFCNGLAERPKMCDDNIVTFVRELEAIANPDIKQQTAEKYLVAIDKMMWELKKKLWLSKVAMYQMGKGSLAVPAKTAWIEKPSKSKKFRVYQCVESGCEDLVMKLTSIDLV